jgi:hypothetical protein
MLFKFANRYRKESVAAHAEVLLEYAAGCLLWIAHADGGHRDRARLRQIFLEMATEAFDRTIPPNKQG